MNLSGFNALQDFSDIRHFSETSRPDGYDRIFRALRSLAGFFRILLCYLSRYQYTTFSLIFLLAEESHCRHPANP